MSATASTQQPSVDIILLIVAATLMAIGFVAIASASIEYADWHYQNPWYHAQRHSVYLLLAGLSAAFVYRVPQHTWQKTSIVWLLVSIALLLAVLMPGIGREVNGSQRWLPIFGALTIQPSEFAKLAVVVFLASYVVRHQEAVQTRWVGFIIPVSVVGFVMLLLMLEPDFGATVIIAATTFGILFVAGVRLRIIASVLAVALLAMAYLIQSAPYRVARLVAYRDPWADPFDSGFQLTQSLIAFGRGEWFGVGLGNSIQKLFYLPEAHTDFVFSIWAEETGLIGTLALISLFVLLVSRILIVARKVDKQGNGFGAQLCYGSALIFSGQAFVNMGVSSGLLPTKGLTLPFVSYGGSSLIISCALLAIVLRVERDSNDSSFVEGASHG